MAADLVACARNVVRVYRVCDRRLFADGSSQLGGTKGLCRTPLGGAGGGMDRGTRPDCHVGVVAPLLPTIVDLAFRRSSQCW